MFQSSFVSRANINVVFWAGGVDSVLFFRKFFPPNDFCSVAPAYAPTKSLNEHIRNSTMSIVVVVVVVEKSTVQTILYRLCIDYTKHLRRFFFGAEN